MSDILPVSEQSVDILSAAALTTECARCIADMISADKQGIVVKHKHSRDKIYRTFNNLKLKKKHRTAEDKWNIYIIKRYTPYFELPPYTPAMIIYDNYCSEILSKHQMDNFFGMKHDELLAAADIDREANRTEILRLQELHPDVTCIVLAKKSYANTYTYPMIVEPERYPTIQDIEPDHQYIKATLPLWAVAKYSN